MSHSRAEGFLVLVTLLAACGWIFSKESLAGMPPWLFLGLRFSIAGVVLLLLGRRYWSSLRDKSQLMIGLGFGVLMTAVMTSWIMGLHYASHLGEGAFISSLGVVLVPILSRIFFGEVLSISTIVALPVAIAGLAFLSLNGGFHFEIGQIYFFISAFLIGLHFALISNRAPRLPSILFTALQLLVVGVLSLILSALFEAWPASLSVGTYSWLLASAFLATCLRFTLQVSAQAKVPASHAALVMILEPVWAALLGWWWYSQSMNTLQLMGCLLIFSALIIGKWRWIKDILK